MIPRRRKEIATYLINEQERFFSGIVLGLYLGEPKWYEIEVADNNLFGTPGLDPRFRQALGILELGGEERLYAIDGQHRVAGIKEALDSLKKAGLEEQYNTLAHEDLGNRHSISTIVTLLDIVRSSLRTEVNQLKKVHQGSRATDAELDSLYDKATNMWLSLQSHSAEIADVMGSEPADRRAGAYRRDDGGHLLFRPIGQQAFSGALGVLRSRDVSTEVAVANLCQVPLELSQPPWVNVMWNPAARRMINSYRTLGEALFLHMIGEPPRSQRYDLEERYQAVYGPEEEAPFKDLPVFSLR